MGFNDLILTLNSKTGWNSCISNNSTSQIFDPKYVMPLKPLTEKFKTLTKSKMFCVNRETKLSFSSSPSEVDILLL